MLREREGWTKEELSRSCGVSRRTVSSWESGDVLNPPLADLARTFGVDESLFYDPPLPAVNPEDVSFRALSSLGARKAKRVVAAARFGLALSNWLDDEFHTPRLDLPTLDDLVAPKSIRDVSPPQLARLLRAAWGLGDKPIKNVMGILEKHGLRVFSVASEDRDVDAFSFWSNGRPYIFLNTEKSAERLRFDLCHELGHIVMHKGLSTSRSKTYEFEANDFASEFLMPFDGVLGQVATASRQLRLSDVMVLKSSWRVSAVAMVRRLFDLKVITEWNYRSWMIDLSAQGYRRGEPDGFHREQSQLLTAVLARARESGSPVSQIAASSGIPKREVQELLLGLCFLPLDDHAPRRQFA